MVYNNSLIVVIKNRGKILREFQGNVVRLPFGSDYSIYIKNKDTMKKALVSIKVDGQDVLDGNELIVSPKSSTELKGFMKNSTVRNKFRFIEKTKEISDYRGNFVEDGLVEVAYRFEQSPEILWTSPMVWETPRAKGCGDSLHTFYSANTTTLDTQLRACCNVSDSGITVPGAETCQDFIVGNIGSLETEEYNIIIHLKGEVVAINKKKKLKKRVRRPVTVKTKVRCSTCGRRWKSSMKYCGNCSTYLH